MRILTVVGARPQFIKCAPVSRALLGRAEEILVHTGQHYDDNMSGVFFEELGIPKPHVNLGIGSGSHGAQTGRMLGRLEDVVLAEQPAVVLVYGDTNSTLAAALVAAKLCVPIAHVEAGLRSFNRTMPEEVNRVVADHLSTWLFCPSSVAAENLAAEGISRGVHMVGDVMRDALSYARQRATKRPDVLVRLGLEERRYVLATVHRAENTDREDRLRGILAAFAALDEVVVLPIHPRTRKRVADLGLATTGRVRLIEPQGYGDMIRLEEGARLVVTDSGGMQKEAYWLGVPCVTVRDETEWVETVAAGWNVVVGADPARIVDAARSIAPPAARPPLYGDGRAAQMIVELLVD